MMKIRIIITCILLSVIYDAPAIFGQDSSGSNRWGIVTKKPANDKASSTDETENVKGTSGATYPVTTAPSGNPPNQVPPETKKETDKSDSLDRESDLTGDKSKQSSESASANSPSPGENKAKQNPAAPDKPQTTLKEIKWTSEAQKTSCQNYMQQLREKFLKARHYSIQGAACETADHAAVFLQLVGKCEKECPKGLLESRGYTSRIVRNITFLEKLGNDRCSGTLPETNAATKPMSDASQPKN